MKSCLTQYKKEIVFTFAMFSVFLILSILIPFNNAPDEYSRYLIAEYITKHHSLPLGTDPEVRLPVWGGSYAFSPYLSYMISSLFMTIVSFFAENDHIILIAARFSNVLCSTITVIFIIAIAGELFSEKNKWIFISFFCTFPCLVFVSSYVNCDAIALTSGTIIVYSWIIGMKSNWNKKSCLHLIIGLSICILSYKNAYGYILLTIILFFYEMYKAILSKDALALLKKGFIIFISVTILGGWFYVRNFFAYDGDFLATKTSEGQAEIYADEEFKPSNKKSIKEQGITLHEMLFDMGWVKTSYRSFIGVFGNMSVNMPEVYYKIYDFVFIIGIISVLLSLNRWKLYVLDKKIFYCLLFAAILIPIILTVYYSYFQDYQPQGRYALSLLLPLSILMCKGFVHILDKLVAKYSELIVDVITVCFIFVMFSIVLNTFFATYFM